MSDNKVTMDQLDNSTIEAMTKSVGDVNMLNTENKTIVGALAEIVGKKVIADAIGEPLAETDKFTEMGNEINGLLSTFKTNMMNAGVVVESGDKFKELIEKIQGLTEGEGSKGVKFAEGVTSVNERVTGSTSSAMNEINVSIPMDLSFTPTHIFVYIPNISVTNSINKIRNVIMSNIINSSLSGSGTAGSTYVEIVSFDSSSLDLYVKGSVGGYYTDNILSFSGEVNWYAIGVGEEDNTLRDSLASILTEKGIEVTEEDDMANLIESINQSLIKKPKLVISDTTNDISFGSTSLSLFGSRTTAPGSVGSTSLTITDITNKCECVSAKVTITHSSSSSGAFVNINCKQYRDGELIATLHNATECWPNHGTDVVELTDFKEGDVITLSGNVTTYNSSSTETFNMSVVTSLQW